MTRWLGCLLLLLLLACGDDDRLGDVTDRTPVDSGAGDAGVRDAFRPRMDFGPPQCLSGTTRVDVQLMVSIEESCAIWNSLDQLAGEATITRSGDMLTIDFGGEVVFEGTISGDSVSLVYRHPHEFTDGCGWEATETLDGAFQADCSLSLSYDYVESVAIDRGFCATPCSAAADVDLILTPLI